MFGCLAGRQCSIIHAMDLEDFETLVLFVSLQYLKVDSSGDKAYWSGGITAAQ